MQSAVVLVARAMTHLDHVELVHRWLPERHVAGELVDLAKLLLRFDDHAEAPVVGGEALLDRGLFVALIEVLPRLLAGRFLEPLALPTVREGFEQDRLRQRLHTRLSLGRVSLLGQIKAHLAGETQI